MSIQIAGASRPYPGEEENGDAWLVDWHEGVCRITVIDALGHGPAAAAIAALAVSAVSGRPQLNAADTLRLCQQVLTGTRGAAISVAMIEPVPERLIYAGIGNVEAQLWHQGEQRRPICYRGIVGVTRQTVRAFELPLVRPWTLIVHSDGISARFAMTDLPGDRLNDPRTTADAILAGWARETDDATVVVACSSDG